MAAAVAASSSSVVAAASSAAPAVACCAVCSATAESLERRTPPCLLLTAKCGHSTICEDCLPRKFEFLDSKFRGVIQCTSCGTDLRDSDYSSKTPEELQVEHALQVRRKVKKECAPSRLPLPASQQQAPQPQQQQVPPPQLPPPLPPQQQQVPPPQLLPLPPPQQQQSTLRLNA
jgi:hypothetical protein